MDISFRDKFKEFAKDGVIDRAEFKKLRELKNSDTVKDQNFADGIIDYLETIDETTHINYTVEGKAEASFTLEFDFAPNHSESDKISGETPFEIVSNISQKDLLKSTNDDNSRCSAASLINAHLLMGGDFSTIASKLGTGQELTYKNVHEAQEKLYDSSNSDKQPGLTSGLSYRVDGEGTISGIRAAGETLAAANKIGLDLKPILGKTKDSVNDKKEGVEEFFNNNPKGTLQVGVNMDGKGNISAPDSSNGQNHFVIVFKKEGKFYMADSGQPSNGKGSNVRELSGSEVSSMVYNTSGNLNALTIKK